MNETVTIENLVHGGQGLATLADGRKAFIWNAFKIDKYFNLMFWNFNWLILNIDIASS